MELAEGIGPLIFAPGNNPGQAYADTAICASNTTPISARQTLRNKPRVTPGLPNPEHGQPITA